MVALFLEQEGKMAERLRIGGIQIEGLAVIALCRAKIVGSIADQAQQRESVRGCAVPTDQRFAS